jgi:hypothetical protein
MMQKRTLYISLLLVSCLLFFGFSYASAQNTVTFESKTAYRCSEVVLNVTVDADQDLSAFELVFQVTGDYSSMSVDFASGLTGLLNRVGPTQDGDIWRMAAMKDIADDACVDPTGGLVVAELTFTTADVCSGSIDVIGATLEGGCCDAVSATTNLVGCDPVATLELDAVVPGSITIVNRSPVIGMCPDDQIVHWGDLVQLDLMVTDPDCNETLIYSVSGPGSVVGGVYEWQTGGDDVCNHEVTVTVTDRCQASVQCSFNICVQNDPPVITHDPTDTIFVAWTTYLTGAVDATDPDGGPNDLLYSLVSFDGPTTAGDGFQLDPETGEWSWETDSDPSYLGDWTLCLAVSDGANTCTLDPDLCDSPSNADTACYTIRVFGIAVTIEKDEGETGHGAIQGHMTEVSIYLESADAYSIEGYDAFIGGFDFLIAYDASALTAIKALPGDLIADTANNVLDKFEYFQYRFGPFGNCGNGCPTGLMRIVGLRETNNGVTNTNHIEPPGELAKIEFLVSDDRTLECMYAPVRFFWLDCGDNTMSDETGNWLYLGLEVYDFLGGLITDPLEYGYTGPMEECFDTVYTRDELFKNAPFGVLIFKNGGVDIICADSIDDRGDINLNGIANEIADAVVFTNYFISGLAAFTINPDGQIAATEVNGDGHVLTVADLVYLIRVIVGDALPLPKDAPNSELRLVSGNGAVIVSEEIGAAHILLEGNAAVTLGEGAAGMEIKTGYDGRNTNVLIYSFNRDVTAIDEILRTDAKVIRMEAADYHGNTYKVVNLPSQFALRQNYPNPFNPQTAIEMELPVAAQWNLAIFNVNGQKVAEFSGYDEAGILTVNWDAGNLASGLYFYKFDAGSFSATKKMVLLK